MPPPLSRPPGQKMTTLGANRWWLDVVALGSSFCPCGQEWSASRENGLKNIDLCDGGARLAYAMTVAGPTERATVSLFDLTLLSIH
jgi:hypothetical protein